MNKVTNEAYLPPIFGSHVTNAAATLKPRQAKGNDGQDPRSARVSDLATDPSRRTRGKQRRPTKQQVTLRLDPDVIAHFKGDDPKGWQIRLNTALRQMLCDRKRQRTQPDRG